MGLFHKLSQSAGLVSGMAERLNVNLAARIDASPDLEAVHFQRLVLRCATCTQQDACTQLQEDNPMLDAAPHYCRNADVFKTS